MTWSLDSLPRTLLHRLEELKPRGPSWKPAEDEAWVSVPFTVRSSQAVDSSWLFSYTKKQPPFEITQT